MQMLRQLSISTCSAASPTNACVNSQIISTPSRGETVRVALCNEVANSCMSLLSLRSPVGRPAVRGISPLSVARAFQPLAPVQHAAVLKACAHCIPRRTVTLARFALVRAEPRQAAARTKDASKGLENDSQVRIQNAAAVVYHCLEDRNIYLIGMMGSGKSTVGALLAQALSFEFVDLDVAIEKQAGRKVPEIFTSQGEVAFRELESAALAEVDERQSRTVVATGGGVVLRPENMAVMDRGFVVWLNIPLSILACRVLAQGNSTRPLLAGGDTGGEGRSEEEARDAALRRLRAVWEQRKDLYARADASISVPDPEVLPGGPPPPPPALIVEQMLCSWAGEILRQSQELSEADKEALRAQGIDPDLAMHGAMRHNMA